MRMLMFPHLPSPGESFSPHTWTSLSSVPVRCYWPKEDFCCLDFWVDETYTFGTSSLYLLSWIICPLVKGTGGKRFLSFGLHSPDRRGSEPLSNFMGGCPISRYIILRLLHWQFCEWVLDCAVVSDGVCRCHDEGYRYGSTDDSIQVIDACIYYLVFNQILLSTHERN